MLMINLQSFPTSVTNYSLHYLSDPNVQSFADLSSITFAQGQAVSLTLAVQIRNDAVPASGNDILAVTGGNANYEFTLQFSDVDVGSGNTDTLSITPMVTAFTSSLSDSLAASNTVNLAGSASITLASGDCLDASFLCIILTTSGIGASYIDSDPSDNSNVHCEDISTQKSCFPGGSSFVNIFLQYFHWFRHIQNTFHLFKIHTNLQLSNF